MVDCKYNYLAFFDLDGTLCPLAGAIPEQTIIQLKMLEDLGCGVVFCSGKPTYYLSAIQRQIGLKVPLMIGENGLMIQIGIDLPPFDEILYHDPVISRNCQELERLALQELGDITWIEPKKTISSLFFRDKPGRDAVHQFLVTHQRLIPDEKIDIIEHSDCFDLLPKGMDKALGVKEIQRLCGIDRENCFAMGDGPNDQGMFDACGYAISINNPDHRNIDYLAQNTAEAMLHLFVVLAKRLPDGWPRVDKG